MRQFLAASLLLLAACGTGRGNAKHIEPQIQIVQTSSVPQVARHESGPLNVRYTVRVTNPSAESITLKRITVQSMSEGAYHVGPYGTPYNVVIAPEQHQDVEISAPARTGLSLVGANGPVSLRVTAEFDSSFGTFQHIVTRVVNDRTAITGEQ